MNTLRLTAIVGISIMVLSGTFSFAVSQPSSTSNPRLPVNFYLDYTIEWGEPNFSTHQATKFLGNMNVTFSNTFVDINVNLPGFNGRDIKRQVQVNITGQNSYSYKGMSAQLPFYYNGNSNLSYFSENYTNVTQISKVTNNLQGGLINYLPSTYLGVNQSVFVSNSTSTIRTYGIGDYEYGTNSGLLFFESSFDDPIMNSLLGLQQNITIGNHTYSSPTDFGLSLSHTNASLGGFNPIFLFLTLVIYALPFEIIILVPVAALLIYRHHKIKSKTKGKKK